MFFHSKPRLVALVAPVLCALFCSKTRADIAVDASKILRPRPMGIGGTVIDAHNPRFATGADGINYQADLKRANVKLVRSFTYPDQRQPDHGIDYFDRNVRAILDAGATPLLIHNIKPDLPYFKEDGSPGGTIESNAVFLVKRYTSAPYNIGLLYVEVSNEPNQGIDYKVATADEYSDDFNRIHEALKKAGLREKVVLCGPVISYPYHWTNLFYKDEIMDNFLEKCKDSVDIVTYHNYVGGGDLAGPLNAEHKLDFMEDWQHKAPIDTKTGKPKDLYGTPALLEKMDTIQFGRPNVGIGLTEHNVNSNRDRVTRALWNLAVTHYYLYNPRGRMTTSFVFDHYGGNQGGLGHYDYKKQPDWSYWALWVRGNLTGDQILSQTVTPNADKSSVMKDGRPLLLVTATKDAKNLYVEVINRSLQPLKDHLQIQNAPGARKAQIHVVAEAIPPSEPSKDGPAPKTVPDDWKGPIISDKNHAVAAILPDQSTPSELGTSFDYEFPALSATIFRFPLGK